MIDILIRRGKFGRGDTDAGSEHHVKAEAEIGVMQCQGMPWIAGK